MTTKEFLDKHDSKECFTEEELYRIWIGDTEIEATDIEEGIGDELDRWNHVEWRIIKIQDRYFEIARYAGNTEYQENCYDCQPIEVKPVEKMIVAWEAVSQ